MAGWRQGATGGGGAVVPRSRRRLRLRMGPWRSVLLVLAAAFAALAWLDGSGTSAASGETGCRVVWVVDGDTVRVWCAGSGVAAARIVGYDTPEVFSPGCPGEWWRGVKATVALRMLLWRAEETVMVFGGTDRYGRRLLTLLVDGRSVAGRMIEDGHGRRHAGGPREGWCA